MSSKEKMVVRPLLEMFPFLEVSIAGSIGALKSQKIRKPSCICRVFVMSFQMN